MLFRPNQRTEWTIENLHFFKEKEERKIGGDGKLIAYDSCRFGVLWHFCGIATWDYFEIVVLIKILCHVVWYLRWKVCVKCCVVLWLEAEQSN
jgi:hypothetical protein